MNKVKKVMGEFKRGELHSGSKSGPVVKKRKQAIAIALSEQRREGYADGGMVHKDLSASAHAKFARQCRGG